MTETGCHVDAQAIFDGFHTALVQSFEKDGDTETILTGFEVLPVAGGNQT